MCNYKLKQIANACNMKPEEVRRVMRDIVREEIENKSYVSEEEVEKMSRALTK